MLLPNPQMTNTLPLLIVLMLGACLLFFFFLLLLYIAISKEKMQKEEKNRDVAYNKAVLIVEEAKTKSLNLLKESSERAKRIIRDADLVVDDSRKIVEEKMHDAAEEMKKDVLEEVDHFSQDLHKEVIAGEDQMRAKIAKEYDLIKKDLDDYKKRRLQEIDYEILKIISDTAAEVIGKTMTPEDHLDFIRETLNKHKKPFELVD